MADIKDDTWVTLSEAAAILGISIRTLQRRIEKGEYETRKEGKSRLVCLDKESDMADTMAATQGLVSYLKQRVNQLEEELEEAKKQIREKDEDLRRKDEQLAEASHRHDTVVMQMTRLLEYHQQPFWRKLFSRKALPPPEQIMDMEIHDDKETEGK